MEALYGNVRNLRENRSAEITLNEVFNTVSTKHPNDWLLSIEIAELAHKDQNNELLDRVLAHLEKVKTNRSEVAHLIQNGLDLIFKKETVA